MMNMAAEKILATSSLVKGLRILLYISYDCMAVSVAVCQVTNKDYYYYYYYFYTPGIIIIIIIIIMFLRSLRQKLVLIVHMPPSN